jgi:carbonic anhydrase
MLRTLSCAQFHFHTPSEHAIDGQYFPLEMHMVRAAALAGTLLLPRESQP